MRNEHYWSGLVVDFPLRLVTLLIQVKVSERRHTYRIEMPYPGEPVGQRSANVVNALERLTTGEGSVISVQEDADIGCSPFIIVSQPHKVASPALPRTKGMAGEATDSNTT